MTWILRCERFSCIKSCFEKLTVSILGEAAVKVKVKVGIIWAPEKHLGGLLSRPLAWVICIYHQFWRICFVPFHQTNCTLVGIHKWQLGCLLTIKIFALYLQGWRFWSRKQERLSFIKSSAPGTDDQFLSRGLGQKWLIWWEILYFSSLVMSVQTPRWVWKVGQRACLPGDKSLYCSWNKTFPFLVRMYLRQRRLWKVERSKQCKKRWVLMSEYKQENSLWHCRSVQQKTWESLNLPNHTNIWQPNFASFVKNVGKYPTTKEKWLETWCRRTFRSSNVPCEQKYTSQGRVFVCSYKSEPLIPGVFFRKGRRNRREWVLVSRGMYRYLLMCIKNILTTNRSFVAHLHWKICQKQDLIRCFCHRFPLWWMVEHHILASVRGAPCLILTSCKAQISNCYGMVLHAQSVEEGMTYVMFVGGTLKME